MGIQGERRNRTQSGEALRLSAAGLVVLAAACATAPPREAAKGPEVQAATRWVPGPRAHGALEALWSAKPFSLDAVTLAEASGGPVARVHNVEILLIESAVRLDQAGRSVEVLHSVWRLLADNPDQTLSFTWSPWHQARPQVRARVVSAQGEESWLDAGAMVEGSLSPDGLELSDVRALRVPLPNARRGAVVELEVIRTDTRPLVEGAGVTRAWELWSFTPIRRLRLTVEAPASAPLKFEAVGVAAPRVQVEGGTQRLALEVGELPFKPLELTRSQLQQQLPRFGWSTSRSWEEVARRYRPMLDEAFADSPDLSALEPLVAAKATAREKAQAVLSWVGDRVRYTAVHLGEGAIVPTRPSTVLARGYGDCKDLAVLVATALRHFGVAAEVALTMAGGRAPSDGLPGLEAFSHMVVVVPTGKDGGWWWLDATAPAYPVGVLPVGVRDQRALILAPGAQGLVSTPTRAETPFAVRESFELALKSFGFGSARLTVTNEGAAEGITRGRAEACDGTAARKLSESPMQAVFGETPFTAAVSHCKAGEGPLTVVADLDKATVLDTGDRSVAIPLPSRVLSLVVHEELQGQRPGADDRTEAQREDQRQQLFEQTGMSEQDVERRSYTFDYRPHVERVYRVALPPHFVVGDLPANRTLAMGPATWTETFASVDAQTVEVHFRFESASVEWSVAEVKAFREAYWKRFDEPVPRLVATFEPARLVDERHAGEAVALMRRWLDERPADGATRARFARVLLLLGLGDLAKDEAEKALRDTPLDPLVLLVRGDVARSDRYGVAYEAPFERAKALECLTRAREQLPKHNWAARALAETLRRNEFGEPEARWTADVAEAARVLQDMVDRNEASDELKKLLVDVYLRGRQHAPLKKLFEQQGGAGNEADSRLAAISLVLTTGLDATLSRIERIADSHERLTALAMAYGTLTQLGRYDDATALLTRVKAGESLEREVGVMRDLNRGLKVVPDAVDLTSPEAAAKSIFAIAANASTPTEASRRFAQLASKTGKAELDGTARLFRFVRLPSLESHLALAQLYHRGACVKDGGAGTFRVRCEVPENRDLSATSYWVTEEGALKLESLGKPSQLAMRAWDNANAKRLTEAGYWLLWMNDDLAARKNTAAAASLLKDFWSQAQPGDPQAVLYAAAVALVVFSDVAKEAPAAVIERLDRGRAALSGALRRRADVVLTNALENRRDYARAARVLKPLAQAENEAWMWRRLASLESRTGSPEALARIRGALEKNPGDVDWRKSKAMALLEAGRYLEALETLKALQAEKGAVADVRNNLLWAQLMADRLDEEAEREALRMGNEKSTGASALHTAAMVLLERGRVTEAADFGARRHRLMAPEVDEAQWLFRARLSQLLGAAEGAKAAYAKIGRDPGFVELRKRFGGAPQR